MWSTAKLSIRFLMILWVRVVKSAKQMLPRLRLISLFTPIPITKSFQKSEEVFEGWRCFNVVVGGINKSDIKSLFGPFESSEVILHLNETNWGSLLKVLEIFPSATQARKNGWDKDIPMGWSEARFKKQRVVVFVLRQSLGRWEKIRLWLLKR